jgi:hypothetical protein
MKNCFKILRALCVFSLFLSVHVNAASYDFARVKNTIKAEVAKKMAKKYGMQCVGEGGKSINCLCWVMLAFEIRRPLDRDQARIIIMDCAEELLTAFNTNKKIRPFLKDYPFSPKNIDLQLFISQKDGGDIYDPDISVVSIYESNEVKFMTVDPHRRFGYKNQFTENYQDALKIVKKAKQIEAKSNF